MNILDLIIVALVVTSAVGGWRLGLITGATSWVLLVQALVLATLALPVVVPVLAGGSPGVRLVVGAVVFVLAGFGGQQAGLALGRRYRRALLPEDGPARGWDRIAGAAVAPTAVVAGFWLLVLPPLGDLAGARNVLTGGSVLARAIDATFPEPPDTSRALRRLVGPAGTPQIFGGLIPDLDAGPPPTDAGIPSEVVARVRAATVRVEGLACRSELDGSGFVVAPGLVVTNAHVVAGSSRTTVVRPDGRRLRARVTAFDPARDLALLEIPELGQGALRLAEGQVGDTVGVFGHPGGQAAVRVAPAAIRQQVGAVGPDLYELGLTRRRVHVLAADLAPGDSGAPVVDSRGQVVGVAFAIARDGARVAYALTTEEVRSFLASDRQAVAPTGPCLR